MALSAPDANTCTRGVKALEARTSTLPGPKPLCERMDAGNTMALFAQAGPSDQAAVDLFSSSFKWVQSLPPHVCAEARGATVPLWNDDRVQWFFQRYPVKGKRGLELGPLEAGHSYMLQQHGVAWVDAVEGDSVHFMKTLVMKNMLALNNVRFHFGDFRSFVHTPSDYAHLGF